jgi:hypothetical protein
LGGVAVLGAGLYREFEAGGGEFVPKWEGRGYTPYVFERVRKWLGIRKLWKIRKTGVCRRLIGKDLREGVGT